MNPSRLHSLSATRLLLPLAIVALLPACTNTSHMLLVQDTHLGLHAAPNPEGQNVGVSFGYRRRFATVIPKVEFGVDDAQYKRPVRNAASVVSAASATFNGPFRVPEVSEVVWTGDAAQNFAKTQKAKEIADENLR